MSTMTALAPARDAKATPAPIPLYAQVLIRLPFFKPIIPTGRRPHPDTGIVGDSYAWQCLKCSTAQMTHQSGQGRKRRMICRSPNCDTPRFFSFF